jgi:hypothetical protein
MTAKAIPNTTAACNNNFDARLYAMSFTDVAVCLTIMTREKERTRAWVQEEEQHKAKKSFEIKTLDDIYVIDLDIAQHLPRGEHRGRPTQYVNPSVGSHSSL